MPAGSAERPAQFGAIQGDFQKTFYKACFRKQKKKKEPVPV
jgi:hypothetical protein